MAIHPKGVSLSNPPGAGNYLVDTVSSRGIFKGGVEGWQGTLVAPFRRVLPKAAFYFFLDSLFGEFEPCL
ncbi:MAG: hypothetical protein ACREJM_01935 [Candidatus Saccharimonadales bacterium]